MTFILSPLFLSCIVAFIPKWWSNSAVVCRNMCESQNVLWMTFSVFWNFGASSERSDLGLPIAPREEISGFSVLLCSSWNYFACQHKKASFSKWSNGFYSKSKHPWKSLLFIRLWIVSDLFRFLLWGNISLPSLVSAYFLMNLRCYMS